MHNTYTISHMNARMVEKKREAVKEKKIKKKSDDKR
jgi:hypothetical protein